MVSMYVLYMQRRRIELEDKTKVVALDCGGGQNPCHASCFASVFLKQMVEFNRPAWCASCFASVFFQTNG